MPGLPVQFQNYAHRRSSAPIWLFSLLGLSLVGLLLLIEMPYLRPPQVEYASETPRPRVWYFSQGKLAPRNFIPPGLEEPTGVPTRQEDLDGDGNADILHLTNGQLEIIAGANRSWHSPSDWNVLQASIADFNRDYLPEVVLLVWRPFKPWPIDKYLVNPGRIQAFHDFSGRSCHLILIGWTRQGFREVWAGSALAKPLLAFAPGDLDKDGFPELVALETAYKDHPTSLTPTTTPERSSALTAWEWNGFGFTLLDRVEGQFQQIVTLATPDGLVYIITYE